MNDKVTHVVSLESWDENFDQVKQNQKEKVNSIFMLFPLSFSLPLYYSCAGSIR